MKLTVNSNRLYEQSHTGLLHHVSSSPVTLKSTLSDTWAVTRRFLFVPEKNSTSIIFPTKHICMKGNFRTEKTKCTVTGDDSGDDNHDDNNNDDEEDI
jgi:hypothetical protein